MYPHPRQSSHRLCMDFPAEMPPPRKTPQGLQPISALTDKAFYTRVQYQSHNQYSIYSTKNKVHRAFSCKAPQECNPSDCLSCIPQAPQHPCTPRHRRAVSKLRGLNVCILHLLLSVKYSWFLLKK